MAYWLVVIVTLATLAFDAAIAIATPCVSAIVVIVAIFSVAEWPIMAIARIEAAILASTTSPHVV